MAVSIGENQSFVGRRHAVFAYQQDTGARREPKEPAG
jgi:hypothetical protein